MTVGLSETDPELKQQFDFFIGERSYLEHRWEDYAGWTLPFLFPHEEYWSTTEMQHDYQSLGAQALNHLANKIAMTLFPPSRPFFRLELTPEQTQLLQQNELEQADIELLTSMAERRSMRNGEKIRLRAAVIMAMKNLIGLGNTLIYYPDEIGDPTQVYNMRDYVVKRDMSGEVMQIITRDRKAVGTLPPEMQTLVVGEGYNNDQKVDLYTGVTRLPSGAYFVKQELEQLAVTTTGAYAENDLPWTALTWNLVRGQDYGNGLVEEYAGDFHVLSSMAEANVNLAAIASDIKILVNPMGQTDVDTLNTSPPGTYVHGVPTDVAYLQLEKMAEFQFVKGFMDDYARRIGSAFMLNTQVTRDAERVTAEEIRMNTNELEASLGGVYSRLAEDMQQPVARYLLKSVSPELAAIEPVILTGVESLSRNSEHEQILLLIQDMTMMQNIPDPLAMFLKYDDIVKVLAANRGLEYQKFLKTRDEVEQDQQQAQQQQAQMAMAESAAQNMGQVAAGQVAGNPTQMGPRPL
jgi:hypothetical protein